MKLQALLAAMALVFSLGASAEARYTHGQDMSAPSMKTFGAANAPAGYLEFCGNYSADCAAGGQRAVAVNLSAERRAELKQVNDAVNQAVRPVTDEVLYKVTEKWTYPTGGQGDCEDYVLAKRRILMDRGWPSSALLITVVRDQNGQGHAVLTVVTDRGDLILDNQRKSIKPWYDTGYYYIKRQSQLHPSSWLSLRDVHFASSHGSTAGAKN